MKLAFDAKRALSNGSGLGNYSRNLLNALMKYFPNEKYLFFSPEVKDEFFHQLTGEFKIILPETTFQKTFHPLWRSLGINNQLLNHRVDVYHGLSNEIPFVLRPSSLTTFVVTIHDLIFLKHKEQYPFTDRQIYKLKTKHAAKHAAKIVAVSNETKNDLMEIYGVNEERVEVIYPLVGAEFQQSEFQAPNPEVTQKYNLPAKYVLNVGSFFSRKNQRVLIEAFDLIKNRVEEDLVLVGDSGNMKGKIEALIEKKNLQNRVKILSSVSNEDVPSVYKAANAFVFPSLYEGFGMPIVEALFSKVPVITTKGGCFEEAGGKNSFYINPTSSEEIADAILKVLNDEKLKLQMRESGYAHAQTMTDKIIAEKTMNLYNKALLK